MARWLSGYFGCIATIARTGSNVIAVGAWLETPWLLDLAATLDGIDAHCVGVYCSLEEAERREALRGDRHTGYTRAHFEKVHAHAPYDAAVDTETMTTAECVQVIHHMLAVPPPALPFFERIRRCGA